MVEIDLRVRQRGKNGDDPKPSVDISGCEMMREIENLKKRIDDLTGEIQEIKSVLATKASARSRSKKNAEKFRYYGF